MQRPAPFIIQPPADFLETHRHLQDVAKQLSDAYDQRVIVTDDVLKAMGSLLWDALAVGDALATAKQAAGLQALPIIIACDDAAIAGLPWETLHHPRFGFLGRESGFTLSRRHTGPSPALSQPEHGPLRVLLFTSLPDTLSETERLDVEAEQAAVQLALLKREQAGEIVLEMPDDGRFETFKTLLREFKPHAVYLSGHGAFTNDPLNKRAHGSFLFEDEWGGRALVDQDTLAACFQNTPVQLVAVSACLSARQHPRFPDSGLSQALFRAGVPHVIGIRESVFDVAGIQFARALMAEIGDRQPIDVAVQRARAAIITPLADAPLDKPIDPARAQASFGQWPLPQLFSHDLAQPLVRWDFQPQPRKQPVLNRSLKAVTLPARFIGRRRELRKWQAALRAGEQTRLLITGAGGMGKTALAGKLVTSLQHDGYTAFVFSARKEHNWQNTVLEMELALHEANAARYQRIQSQEVTAQMKAEWLLRLLLQQSDGKLVLFFDNLESAQDENTQALTEAGLQAWLVAAYAMSDAGVRVVATSRWQLPDWPASEHVALSAPIFSDYLAFARGQKLPAEFLGDFARLRRAYATLGGNFRALEFFAQATQGMNLIAEQAFVAKLAQATAEIQTNMALAEVMAQRSAPQRELLRRMLAYETLVPLDGVKIIAKPDLQDAPALLATLARVSLVEQVADDRDGHVEYQLSPLVRDWLLQQGVAAPEPSLRKRAAAYLLWLCEENIKIDWEHRLAVHQALVSAGEVERAHRFVLDWIVAPLNRAGRYRELLEKWLPATAESADPETRGAALGQIGKQWRHLGKYSKALDYYRQSLKIRRDIGDKAGEAASLNNISQICQARGDYATALDFLQQSLTITREIGDKAGEGATLNNISRIYDVRGDYATALDLAQQSLKIIHEIGDKAGEAASLNNISQICQARGDYTTALNFLQQSFTITREIGDKAGEGVTLNNIGQIYQAYGDIATALDFLQQSLTIRHEIGDKAGEAATLNNISGIYRVRGDTATALAFLQQSLTITREIGDKAGENTTLNNIGQIYEDRSKYTTALDYYQQSLAITREIGDKAGEGITLNNISGFYRASGDTATALHYLQQSLTIQHDIGDMAGLCPTLFNIGHIHWQKDEDEKAVLAWVTVYRIASRINLAQTLHALEDLAGKIGLAGGLQGWAQLAQQFPDEYPM
jgi:tetratricopeptide (TPR) repeat protein